MHDTSRHFTVSVQEAETHAWEIGEGTGDDGTLVLVHGFRGDHHGLALIAQSLSKLRPGLRIITPDLPGFGRTPPIPGKAHDLNTYADWLTDFVNAISSSGGSDHSDTGDIALLGHSFGSLIVAKALADGLRSSRLILINPIVSPALEGPNAFMTNLATLYYRAADALPDRSARALLGNGGIVRVMSEVMAKTRDPKLRRWIHGQHAQYFSSFADTGTLGEAFTASVSHTVRDYSAALDMPTLLIVGDRDDIAPLTDQLSLHRLLPASILRIIPGVGHLVHYEAPEDSAAFSARFLDGAFDAHTGERRT